jgi:hypothetical protein
MRDMLAAQGAQYLHVLQPNQYFTQRVFSDEEARVARSEGQPFRTAVEAGYPVLARSAAALVDKEEFLDATTAFDGERNAVYNDDCCHYTDRGYEILAETIAARVLQIRK